MQYVIEELIVFDLSSVHVVDVFPERFGIWEVYVSFAVIKVVWT